MLATLKPSSVVSIVCTAAIGAWLAPGAVARAEMKFKSQRSTRGLWLVLGCTVFALRASPAAASSGGYQTFAFADQPAQALGFAGEYGSNPTFTGPWSADIVRTAVGQYTVLTCNLPDQTFQTQVVAVGSDNVRCKLAGRSIPWHWGAQWGTPASQYCIDPKTRRGPLWGMQSYVTCNDSAGRPVNSKFMFQMSVAPVGAPGTAAYIETKNGVVANAWALSNRYDGYYASPAGNGMTSGGNVTVTHLQVGFYAVTMPGLGTKTPGVAQVTALGSDPSHCNIFWLPTNSGNDPTTLVAVVACYVGNIPFDTDFMFNYDASVTRPSFGYQGARFLADQPSTTSLYTPSSSYNSGSVSGIPGTNDVVRTMAGEYDLLHTTLSGNNAGYYAVASGFYANYCKLVGFGAFYGSALAIVHCYDYNGKLVDSPFVETYQGPQIAPQ